MTPRLMFGVALLTLSILAPVWGASPLLDEYVARAGGAASPQRGQQLWQAKDPKGRSCTACHGLDLRVPGKHERTGKAIAPMAPSVNPERYTDGRKVAKWFKRNCKWTLGRECTSQEQADLLGWLVTL